MLQLFRNNIDAKVGPVDRDRLALTIHDPAAAGRDYDQLEPVGLRLDRILLMFGGGETDHPCAQCPAEYSLSTADEHHSPREGDRLVSSSEAGGLHRPSLHRSRRDAI